MYRGDQVLFGDGGGFATRSVMSSSATGEQRRRLSRCYTMLGEALVLVPALRLPGRKADRRQGGASRSPRGARSSNDVGLSSSTDRSAGIASGGEAQRIRLASQIGSSLAR